MLELSGDHIQKLGDEDLRELVFRLCEAELRRNGLPVSSVTAGGNQTAADGGIDVRVEAPTGVVLDFIKRPNTAFQVKCEDMPAGKIRGEMCPDGVLRSSIRELIAVGGAYIIVSSKGSIADAPLRNRRMAMEAAVKDQVDSGNLLVDCYGRERLATWTRGYPGVEMWVRERIQDVLGGWQGYGNWSNDKVGGNYLRDDVGRVIAKTTGSPEAMSAERGIDAIRDIVSKPGGVVRLVGLSGTGKTRLAQALFESGIGATASLDQAIALYTDQGRGPQPSAREMCLRLGAQERRAIVVVDNCNPETHRALADIVAANAAYLSLATVEYDVAADEPEATYVFELTASSDDVLEQILGRLAPQVEQGDRTRIAEFAGGNARVALALARTLQKGETLGVLNDTELFSRLFLQNNAPNEALLRSAEACSLVYSFDGEDMESAESELRVLAGLADLQTTELYRHVAELKQRDLVQSRSRWRAILPHALANRLAKQALVNLPPSSVVSTFAGHVRLLRSFSRRLGYLHDCKEACAIAERWVDDEDWLANPAALNDLGLALFLNLAPLIPAKALQAIESAVRGAQGVSFTSSTWPSRDRWISLTRSLAYDVVHFERAARIVLCYAEGEDVNRRDSQDAWKELFHVVLSGTQAPAPLRIALLRDILSTGTARQQSLALEGVGAMLETTHFTSSHDFAFGARPRNYGWEPSSHQDVRDWYGAVFELAREIASPGSLHRGTVRRFVASHFRGLWSNLGMQSAVVDLARSVADTDGWPEGWTATRQALRFDSSSMQPALLDKLRALEAELRPKTLHQQVRAYVFSQPYGHLDVAEGEDSDDAAEDANPVSAHERVALRVEALGVAVDANEPLLELLLPDLLSDGSGQQSRFGLGVGKATKNVQGRWMQLYSAYAKLEPPKRDLQFLGGFIEGVSNVDKVVANRILDSLVCDPLLAEQFPRLQGHAADDAAAVRLLSSIHRGIAPARSFYAASIRRRGHGMSTAMYGDVIRALAGMPGGLEVAIESIGMEIYVHRSEKTEVPNDIVLLGRDTLASFDFAASGGNIAYHLKELAEVCLRGPDAKEATSEFCRRFAQSLRDYKSHADLFAKLACTLFKLQPDAALDAFVGQEQTPLGYSLLSRFALSRASVVNCADEPALLAWVERDPGGRASLVAAEVNIVGKGESGNLAWSPIASKLLAIAPDRAAVLGGFEGRFRPRAWTGSLTEVLRPYIEMTQRLSADCDPTIAEWASTQLKSMQLRTAAELRTERRSDESFE